MADQRLNLILSATNSTDAAFTSAKGNVTDLEKKASTSTSALGGMGKALGGVASIASGFVIGQGLMAAPGLLMSIGREGAALELQTKKIGTVFGEQTPIVQAWATQNAAAMGLTKTAAAGLAANFADLLIPMGFTREAAAEMSTSVVGLSGALSEWSGGTVSAAQASEILAKAMLGERDGLKSLGISISEADVSARLLANGQAELTGQALEQAKALATQQLIMEKSTDAQAAFAAGAGSAARQQAENTARINEAKESITTGLLPAYEGLMRGVAAALPVVIEFGTTLVQGVGEGVDFVKRHLPEIKATFDQTVAPIAADVAVTVAAVQGHLQALVQGFREHWDQIEPIVRPVLEILQTLTQTALDNLVQLVRVGMALLRGDWSTAWDGTTAILENNTEAWKTILRVAVTEALPAIIRGAISLHAAATEALMEAIKAALVAGWEQAKEGARAGLDAVLELLRALPGQAVAALGNLGSLLYSQGRAIVQGLWDGMKSLVGDFLGWVGGLGKEIADRKGPLDTDRQLLYPAGVAIMEGLAAGLDAGWMQMVTPRLAGMTAAFSDAHMSQTTAAGYSGRVAWMSGGETRESAYQGTYSQAVRVGGNFNSEIAPRGGGGDGTVSDPTTHQLLAVIQQLLQKIANAPGAGSRGELLGLGAR